MKRSACPGWLAQEAKKVYRDLARALEAQGRMSKVDRHLLAQTAEAGGELRLACEALAAGGPVVTYSNGNMGPSPWCKVRTDAARRLRAGLAALGLEPRSRPLAPREEETDLDRWRRDLEERRRRRPLGGS